VMLSVVLMREGPWCWVLQTLNFNVADVEFRCCKHVMLGVVSRRRGGRAPHVGCCTQHRSQHGRNIVATWSHHVGEVEERRPMLDVACNLVRNMLGTRSQHTRNILRWMLHGRRFATWGKALRNIEKVFRNILCASQPDRRLIGSPHPNRAAQHPSDASARIRRPGASSSVLIKML
jgi:hypothetical protein